MQDLISNSPPLPWTQILIKLLQPKQNKIATTSTYFSGEGNGNPLQYSCLENPMDGGAWWLPSMGLHRVRHDWSNLAAVAATYFSSQRSTNSPPNIIQALQYFYFLNLSISLIFLLAQLMHLKGLKKNTVIILVILLLISIAINRWPVFLFISIVYQIDSLTDSL